MKKYIESIVLPQKKRRWIEEETEEEGWRENILFDICEMQKLLFFMKYMTVKTICELVSSVRHFALHVCHLISSLNYLRYPSIAIDPCKLVHPTHYFNLKLLILGEFPIHPPLLSGVAPGVGYSPPLEHANPPSEGEQ